MSRLKSTQTFKIQFLCPKYWGIWLGFLLLRLISFLPRRLKFFTGKKIGQLLYYIAPSRKSLARKNLQLSFPEKNANQIESILKEHFESLGISLIETTINLWGNHRHPQKKPIKMPFFTFHGLENLQQYPSQGLLLVVPHFTTIETTGLMLSHIMPFRPIYRKHDNPLMEYLITKSRTLVLDSGQSVAPLANSNTRAMIKALKDHENIMILPDQRYRAKGNIKVPFFGVDAPSNPGICKLAKLGNAKVLPVFTKRNEQHYEMTILPGLDNFPSGDDYSDILRLHQLYEAEIKANPAQYLWTHNRWNLKKGRDF